MSYRDYVIGREIAAEDYPFYALIQAAMRKADSENLVKLQAAFPLVAQELRIRYNAPGGILLSDRVEEALRRGE